MPLPPLLHARALRIVAILLSLVATSHVLGGAITDPANIKPRFWIWLLAYVAYVTALWFSFEQRGTWQSRGKPRSYCGHSPCTTKA